MWLTYLGHVTTEESAPFFDLILAPFENPLQGAVPALVQFIGFLHLLADLLKTMRNHVRAHLPRLMAVSPLSLFAQTDTAVYISSVLK